MNDAPSPLAAFADYLSDRREALLEAWRASGIADSGQPVASTLTRAQFYDHIPEVLDALEDRLRHRPGSGGRTAEPDRRDEAKHGLQRWQQGYRLEELMREWGDLHLCLLREVERYATSHLQWPAEVHSAALREIAALIHEGVARSAAEYARLDRADAAGRLHDLELAINRLRQVNEQRITLLRQAVHDLRGNVQSVSTVADLLGSVSLEDRERVEFAGMLQRNIDAVAAMLGDMTELTRLEAGQEGRTIAPFDAARLLRELCDVSQARAKEAGLYLRTEGPANLATEGDAGKVRRLVQNLVMNALNYTKKGGVTVSWGTEPKHWWVRVQDTGPGLLGGPGSPLVVDLRDATATARESDVSTAAKDGHTPTVLDQSEVGPPRRAPRPRQLPGEGIGLSIVKRLCELLDASLELVSSSESGTIVRVVFPQRYPADPAAPAK